MKSLLCLLDLRFMAKLCVRWRWLGWFRAGWCSEEQPAAESFSAKMQQHATTVSCSEGQMSEHVKRLVCLTCYSYILVRHFFSDVDVFSSESAMTICKIKPDVILVSKKSKKTPSSGQCCKHKWSWTTDTHKSRAKHFKKLFRFFKWVFCFASLLNWL